MSDYDAGYAEGMKYEQDRLEHAAGLLSDAAHYRVMQMAGSVHPCEAEGCVLSQEEHHRLAYGILNEIKELKRRVAELERGVSK